MANTTTPRVALGASTTNRKWWCDIDTANSTSTPTWIGLFGILEFQDGVEQTMQDDSDFDSGGFKSQTTTALAVALTVKLKRAIVAAGTTKVYDPGQEFLRAASNKMGNDNRVHIRYYEMEPNGPRVEAYELFVTVGWSPDGGGMDALSTVTATLTGQGERKAITHPAGA